MAERAAWSSFAIATALVVTLGATACQFVSGISGMTFGAGGAGGAGGTELPVSCKQASDCPPPLNPCEIPLCVGELCGTVGLPAGSNAAATAQKPGDCQVLVCNGSGMTTPRVEDSDVFDDGSDCTEDLCINGVPFAKPRPFGLTCGPDDYGKCNDAGACVGCLADIDCGALTACAKPRCVAGTCDAGFTAKGTLVGVQTPGDCQQRTCDGAGLVKTDPDDADVPDDGNDCTDDVCALGIATNPAKAMGDVCGNAVAMTCDGSGSCTGCATADDCAGVDNACRVRSCSAGTCALTLKPEGANLPAQDQTVGDCRAKACTGLGLIAELAADDPPAEDGNACTKSTCVEGAAEQLPSFQGTPCTSNGGKVCDGSGACVTCNAGADCTAPEGICVLPVCTAHACAIGNVAANQPAAESKQNVGDCLVILCDGNGASIESALDADVPFDAKPCTQDACVGGKPVHTPEVVGVACQTATGGKKCDGKGSCVQCLVDVECNGGQCLPDGSCDNCTSKSCVSLGLTCGQATDGCGGKLVCDDLNKNGLETDVDCGGDKATCGARCELGKGCSGDVDCASGHCAQGVCCNVVCEGGCRSCAAADTGGTNGQCGFIAKGADPFAQCEFGKACDGGGGCKLKLGQGCGLAGQCLSGFCPAQDGTCCETACDGKCSSCQSTKTGDLDGACVPVLLDTDPDSECPDQGPASCAKTGGCDGAPQPACKLYTQGTVCKAGSCDGPTAFETKPATCDGGGTCGSGAITSCGGYACGQAACKTTCAADTDCFGASYCEAKACVAKKPQGNACMTDNQCAAGFCRDGTCCNSDCPGTCSACSALKTGLANGTCGSVLLGSDPDAECLGATPICSGQSSCAACGAALAAPGGVCPAECTGGCNLGTNTCNIDCSKNDSQCLGATLTCPAGWNCRVACTQKASCKSATVVCPSNYACNVDCGGGGESESCALAVVLCKNGNCNLACKGAVNRTACKGATMSCGGNACTATCDFTYFDPAGFASLTKNDACSCTNCGFVACK